ncbi:MAG: DUF1566 domain-containing protein [Gammaproteobacteria bacterium]|nr:DUF1566 domain-containing protein [Gammaproteobacteria bacterium]
MFTKRNLINLKLHKSISTIFVLTVFASSTQAECFYDNIQATTPSSRFNINSDGTVTDKKSGLVWKRCSEGQTVSANSCNGNLTKMSWQQALNSAKSNNDNSFANANNWRLPNIKELQSIVEYACQKPAINSEIFPNVPNITDFKYWSSSTKAGEFTNPIYAWAMRMDDGSAYFQDKTLDTIFLVRLVRDTIQ